MKCPRDGTPLKREIFCGLEIDSCVVCDGTWLDKGELAKISGLEGDTLEGEEAVGNLPDRKEGEFLVCPKCGEKMKPYFFSRKKVLIVDMCPKCGGVWLDAKELKKALELVYYEIEG